MCTVHRYFSTSEYLTQYTEGPVHTGPKSQVTWGQSVWSQPLRAWKSWLTTSNGILSPKSQVTWGQSVWSQPLRAWKSGLTTSHGSQVLSPKSLEANPCDLSRWEHGSRDLPLHTGSQVLSPESLEANMCNLNGWEHGSWDLPLHTGFKSQVLSHLRPIRAISVVESMEVGTYHFTWVSSLKTWVTWGQSVQSQLSRAWKLGLTTSHGVLSPKPRVTWGQSVQSQPLRAWKLGLTTSYGVPSPKSPKYDWMPTWQHFLEVRLGTCAENLGWAKT